MLLESFLQDIRIGLRVLIKEKSFSLLAVFVLALGICGVTTQFTVVNALVLRGFSFPQPEQLMNVGLLDPLQNANNNNNGLGFFPSATDYEEIRSAQQSFAMMAAYINGSTVNVTVHGNPLRYTGAYVTDNFFRILGVAPIIGRDFTAADNLPGAERVTLISHQIWQHDFGGKADVLGQTVRMNGRTATIIGVMPPKFQFPVSEELWVPLYNEFPVRPRGDPQGLGPNVFGRLKPGVSVDQANVEFAGLARRMAFANPKTNRQLVTASVAPLINNFIGPQIRQTLYAMLGAVVMVLLIACVNVMNMQFARAALRAKELAIRGALGATRWRLVRQMLTESLLLATLGAAAGVLLAYWAVDFLFRATQSLPFPLPYWVSFDIDGPVLAFTVGLTLLAALLSGLVPALLTARASAAAVMKESGRGNTSRLVNRLTRGLVVTQIALTAALLIASSLQIKAVVKQTTLNYGYDENGVYTARMGLFEGDYPTPESRMLFFQRSLRALRANPSFDGAALTGRFRMTFGGFGQYEVDGKVYVTDKDRPQGNFEFVSDGYFSTIGLKIIEGRDFTIDDTDAKQPVALVNASFAQKYFGRGSPLGQRVRIYNPSQPQPWRTIVGVVPDTLMQGPFNQQTDNSGFYVPLLGVPPMPQFATLVVRPHGGLKAEGMAAPLRQAMNQLDANLPLYFAGTPAHLHDEILGFNRITATLFSIFGIVAVVLAAVGLYGVMSFSVNQRMQEFGIRMALGADARKILGMVMGQGAWQLAGGLVVGLGAMLALVQIVGGENLSQNFLAGINPLNPAIYASVAALLAVVAVVSCHVPARRATRVDPMIALRAE
jgi:putative ABC transport system permease protein